jgi:hypothetical protein
LDQQDPVLQRERPDVGKSASKPPQQRVYDGGLLAEAGQQGHVDIAGQALFTPLLQRQAPMKQNRQWRAVRKSCSSLAASTSSITLARAARFARTSAAALPGQTRG